MAAENGTEEQGEVRMTRTDLQTMIAEAITADREERKAEQDELRAEVTSLRADNTALQIERKVAELNDKKLPPAFVKKAEELLAGRTTAEGLSLTRTPEGGEATEITLSIVDVIDELAATVPQSLETSGPKVRANGKPADGEKTPEEKAAELLAEIQGGDVVVFEDEQ